MPQLTSLPRVVITGLGAISPLGTGAERLWAGLLAGESGIREIQAFDTQPYSVHRGGVVPEFDPLDYMSPEIAARAGQASRYAIAATRLALDDARLDLTAYAPDRVGVCLGTTSAEIAAIEEATVIAHKAGPEAVPATLWAQVPASQIPGFVAAAFGFSGPNTLVPTACAAGNYALGFALDQIRSGRVDMMIAGGVDPFSQIAFTGFHKLASMAPDVPRPFSADREGMMVGEGAGVLVLETLDAARARGATIYAEVLGYGLSCDAHHMTAPHPEGRGAYDAMSRALAHAGVGASAVDYISAHGTGTPTNDKIETLAVQRLFGDRATQVPISSIKSMLGHTMGAASALEAIACVLAIRDGRLPPTANFRVPDPECAVDCVPNVARQAPVAVALSNAYAFGGNNAVIVLSRVEEAVS
jgi:3-oxoacyl-[acyl-carrier-protein] synthase II